MGEAFGRWRWGRYQRGLRTIPVIVLASVVVWAITGGGAFWPGFVLLAGGLTISFRAQRAMRLGPPDEMDELEARH
jgi:1,4-dihydroxy-2-naphthoyl-CoA synthase